MANLELFRSHSPKRRRQVVAPEDSTAVRALGYHSDDGGGGGWTADSPPPDYCFLSDSELPSARYHGMTTTRHHRRSPNSYEASTRSTRETNEDSDESESTFNEEVNTMSIHDMEDDTISNESDPLLPGKGIKRRKKEIAKKLFSGTRIGLLALLLVLAIIFFSIKAESEDHYILASVSSGKAHTHVSHSDNDEKWYGLQLHMRGPFNDIQYVQNQTVSPYRTDPEHGDPTDCSTFMAICIGNRSVTEHTACEVLNSESDEYNCVSVQLLNDTQKLLYGEHSDVDLIKRTLSIKTTEEVTVNFMVSKPVDVHFEFSVMGEILSPTFQIVLAGLTLVIVYVLIVFDLVHRTIAAMIGSTVVLGVLSMLHKRPTLETAVEWLSLETICLLFGMMVLVAVFSQTGFFDYFAVKCYKLSRGKVWPLISLLCLFSAVVSAFLDNVTTILLLTPVSIRLCQVLNLDPVPVLIAEVLFSNIGGTATAIGDPPNVIIISHDLIGRAGINFAEFTLHLLIGIIFCTITAYGVLAIFYYFVYVGRKDKDPPHIAELKREIAIWERTARLMPIVSLEERAVRDALRNKAQDVRQHLKEQRNMTARSSIDLWRKNLEDLETRYRITDKWLLCKSTIVLVVVILMFFSSHFLPGVELNLGWIAIFGALVLLILADVQELEGVLHKVEWGTLLFFAGLFVLMEGLAELGLMDFIGEVTVDIIKNVDENNQLLVAIVLVLWVSAIVSSFIDNIPFTQAMIPVIIRLADSPEVCLPIRPLVWTLAFGACLGGNGTLIGASANVVCAGLAEQNGYKISFNGFFKMGFPMMIVTVFTVMIYLLICHVALNWDVSDCTPN